MSDPVLDIFREEAREHLRALERAFLDLETTAEVAVRRNLIHQLFRHAHSLKSDAKVVGLGQLKAAAQELEDILDDLREKPESVDREAINRGLGQFDRVRGVFEAWQQTTVGGEVPVVTRLDPAPPAGPQERLPTAKTSPAPAEAPPPAPATTEESFTVRVPTERLDRMLNTVGEVRMGQQGGAALASRLLELREQLTALVRSARRHTGADLRQELEASLDLVRRLERDLHRQRSRADLLMEALETDIREARLLPLLMLTDSLRRVIRDLAHSLEKPIRYEVQVGRILLDKAVIEALRDPLMHLLRNAADHGLEGPAERRATGKPAEGCIRIAATQVGQLVRLTVSDDGRGVNFERIREQLRRGGRLEEAELAGLSEQELAQHLFQPGFSTAPRGEVSGRGVGLDVVRDAVHRLHGTVDLQSSSPEGTAFTITVPVTISTVRILTVLSGGQFYGIPTTAIIRAGRARRTDLGELAGQPILPVAGQPVRWLHLSELLGQSPSQQAMQEDAWSYVLLGHQGQLLAVAVDGLEDEAEVVLKPLGFPLAGLPGVVGATLRANGAVQLVLDLTSPTWARTGKPTPQPSPQRKTRGRILVVDDSPTTRAVLRNVFTAAGYSVTTASDGMDALERLRGHLVDLVVSDVEMPRLNGFDLTRQIKTQFGLPVILVTGREKDEHRHEGFQVGADAYIVKSTFQGEGLLEIVEQFL